MTQHPLGSVNLANSFDAVVWCIRADPGTGGLGDAPYVRLIAGDGTEDRGVTPLILFQGLAVDRLQCRLKES